MNCCRRRNKSCRSIGLICSNSSNRRNKFCRRKNKSWRCCSNCCGNQKTRRGCPRMNPSPLPQRETEREKDLDSQIRASVVSWPIREDTVLFLVIRRRHPDDLNVTRFHG